MFTGIVEAKGTVEAVERRGDALGVAIRLGALSEGVRVGDSIAVAGCCLTVVALDGDLARFDAIPETLDKTWLGALEAGRAVNLERSLRLGARLDGHLVQGHVDGVARCVAREPTGGPWGEVRFAFEGPTALTDGMVHKGSIAIDGVSLTLTEVDAGRFAVAIIPHTLQVTTFGALAPGDPVNIETDVFGKWIRKAIEPYLEPLRRASAPRSEGG